MIVKANNELSYGKLDLLSKIVTDFAELEEDNFEECEYPSGMKYDYDKIQDLLSEIVRLKQMRQRDVDKMQKIAQTKPGKYLVIYKPFDGIEERYLCSNDEDLSSIPHLVK